MGLLFSKQGRQPRLYLTMGPDNEISDHKLAEIGLGRSFVGCHDNETIPAQAYFPSLSSFDGPVSRRLRRPCRWNLECTFTLHRGRQTVTFFDRAGLLTMVGELVEKAFEEGDIAVSSNFGFGSNDYFFSHENAEEVFRLIKQGVDIMQRIDCIVDDEV